MITWKRLRGTLVVLAIIAGVLILVGGVLAALVFAAFDTQYTPGYSERKFRSIKLGDSEELVLAALGAPFSTLTAEPYQEWIYSADKQQRFALTGEGRGTFTTIRFDAGGRVVSVHGMVQNSRGNFTYGDSMNYLGLTPAQIEQLKGSTPEEIQRQFGSPRAVYADPSSRQLYYSRSPSSGNYFMRIIGLGADGKVVRVDSRIYWD